MMGFTLVEDSKCNDVKKPTFKGKSKGDANCDGYIDVIDFSLWQKNSLTVVRELLLGRLGMPTLPEAMQSAMGKLTFMIIHFGRKILVS